MRARYRAMASGRQVHSAPGSPSWPHGHGFIAAISTKRAGYVAAPPAREIVIAPSSRGLTKRLEHRRLEFAELIQKQRARVRE